MQEINAINDICELARTGFSQWDQLGYVDVKQQGDLLLFNYSHYAQVVGRWNALEMFSRGLIINRLTGEVVARPFDKFFNWNEGGRTTEAPIRAATEKIDGALGVLYRDGEYKVASRGAFDSVPANWATELLRKQHNLNGLPEEWTLIFEILCPGQRIIVDYGNRNSLVLLAIRNRFTGDFLPLSAVADTACNYGFELPKVYDFASIDDILEQKRIIDGNEEGWVVEFADHQRFKFKGDRYLELHKLAAALSIKTAGKSSVGKLGCRSSRIGP